MSSELRGEFHRELDRLDIAVSALLDLLADAIRAATDALLAGDDGRAAELRRWRALVEGLYGELERSAEQLVARQAPVAGDLRFIFTCVRIVPHLQEAVDLVAEVAAPASASVALEIDGRVRSLIGDLGTAAADAWDAVSVLWHERRDGAGVTVGERDDRIAEIRSSLAAEAATEPVSVPVAMELALIGRCYERLGRHAVLCAARIEPLLRRP